MSENFTSEIKLTTGISVLMEGRSTEVKEICNKKNAIFPHMIIHLAIFFTDCVWQIENKSKLKRWKNIRVYYIFLQFFAIIGLKALGWSPNCTMVKPPLPRNLDLLNWSSGPWIEEAKLYIRELTFIHFQLVLSNRLPFLLKKELVMPHFNF